MKISIAHIVNMDELYIIIYIYSTEIERQKLNLFCYTRVGVLSKRYNICLHLFSNCAHNLEILPLVAKGCEIEAYDQNVQGFFSGRRGRDICTSIQCSPSYDKPNKKKNENLDSYGNSTLGKTDRKY